MKKILLITLTILFSLNAQALFEVKDASDNTVFSISNDGMRVINDGDTMMVISTSEARISLDNSKGLSRSFSVSTNATGKGTLAHVLEVGTQSTYMSEGGLGARYTDFSPENMFLGLHSGESNVSGINNVFLGNYSGYNADDINASVFIGVNAGYNQNANHGNVYVGQSAGMYMESGGSNVFIGTVTGMNQGSGEDNVIIGAGAANMLYENGTHTGNRNVVLGAQSGDALNGDDNVFIGYGAGYGYIGSDRLYIDNSTTATPLIYGNFATNAITINGTLTTTGSTTVGGTFTSNGNAYMKGTSFQIYTNPGSGTTPTNYVYQGSGLASISKQYAFTINDALWVTSHTWMDGDLTVTGTTYKSADEVKIDHPLDPENKSLSHSNVISDERMSVYSGNVILDSDGMGIVNLPDWFESLNTEFRYQLTPIGGAASSLHIAKEISHKNFEIAGGKPNIKVSWMVTAIRNDKYAKENPLKIETMKNVSNKQIEEE